MDVEADAATSGYPASVASQAPEPPGAGQPAPASTPRRGRSRSKAERSESLAGLFEGIHAIAAGLYGPDLAISREEGRKLASAVMECAEEFGLDMEKYSKTFAVGQLVTAFADVEGPKLRALLAGTKTTARPARGPAPAPAQPRPELYVPAQGVPQATNGPAAPIGGWGADMAGGLT